MSSRLVSILCQVAPAELENLVKSAHGSKLMQDMLTKYRDPSMILMLKSNLILHQDALYRIMTNKYSNYFVSLFFSLASAEEKSEVCSKLLGDSQGHQLFIKTAMNQIGTHCMQKLFDQIKDQ